MDDSDASIVVIEPMRAVQLAAEAVPRGALVRVRITVQATGAERDRIFLNSERDYRDQRNLTLVLSRDVAHGLEEQLGADVRMALMGRTISVTGVARRTTIVFLVDGKPTDKFYYQTHLHVSEPKQLQLESEAIDASAPPSGAGR